MRRLLFVSCLLAAALVAVASPADPVRSTPVTVTVVGKGQIRIVVSDGTSKPCDSSDNRKLFDGHAKAGERLDLRSLSGSVCVDHTFGSLRESQWAGASIWSGSGSVFSGVRSLDGLVSTDEP
jgi:hypothetical protein